MSIEITQYQGVTASILFFKRLPQTIHQVRKCIDTTQYLLTALLTPVITYCTCILGDK